MAWYVAGWGFVGLLVLIVACLVGLIWHLRASNAELRRLIAEAPGVSGSEPQIIGSGICEECADGNHADCEGGECECDCRDAEERDVAGLATWIETGE